MSAETTASRTDQPAVPWELARKLVYEAGLAAVPIGQDVPLSEADGRTLAAPLATLTDLPAFPTSSIDGYAVRGEPPWRVTGRVLAGGVPEPLLAGDSGAGAAIEIATGAMVPVGTAAIIRTEESRLSAEGLVTGTPRPQPEWRVPGEEAAAGEELLPAGTPVDPGVLALAAHCGYDHLSVRRSPRVAVLVFGDELLTTGPPGDGRVRDALGPAVPAWLRRLGATVPPGRIIGPVEDTLEAHVDAIRQALSGSEPADLICTTGGTMHGPVDHLHPALRKLGADYLVNTVAVRPGFPMLIARIPGVDGPPRFVAGLPGNPQSAIVALVSLVVPLLAGLQGRGAPKLPLVTLGGPVPGRGDHTHLALARLDDEGVAWPVRHVGSAMLRGLATAAGFVVIPPGSAGQPGDRRRFVPLPLFAGERP